LLKLKYKFKKDLKIQAVVGNSGHSFVSNISWQSRVYCVTEVVPEIRIEFHSQKRSI